MSLYLGENLVSGVATPIEGARNIGQVIQSTIPLTDAGLHLLDGSLISGSGSYSAFVTYIAGLVSSYPDCFCSESDWQTAVTTYGVCGKFVYDSVNNTVRLPKITGFTEGTTDVTALGDLIQAGLPNITVSSMPSWDGSSSSGALEKIGDTAFCSYASGGSLDNSRFDASRCSSVYGNSNTVQPQAIKVLYYIVIATSTKTDIEVDIDEIATDLNGKADVDLSNVSNTAGFRKLVEVYNNGASWYKVYKEYDPSNGNYIGLWCEQGGFANAVAQDRQVCQISFLKTFANTNYFFRQGVVSNSWQSSVIGVEAQTSRAVGSVYVWNFSSYCSGLYWIACGYIS